MTLQANPGSLSFWCTHPAAEITWQPCCKFAAHLCSCPGCCSPIAACLSLKARCLSCCRELQPCCSCNLFRPCCKERLEHCPTASSTPLQRMCIKTCAALVADSAWVHLSPSPGSFKLTCGASRVDHLLFQPAPVAGLVLQSIQLCPATGTASGPQRESQSPAAMGENGALFHTCIV